MSCSSGACGKSFFPLPPGGGGGFDPRAQPSGRDRAARRGTFFSRRLQHVSAVAQDPASITVREFAYLILAIFALYRGYFAVTAAWHVLFRLNVYTLCGASSFGGCGWIVGRALANIAWDWAYSVAPWAMIGAVVVFFAEEAIGRFLGKAKA